MPEKRRPTMRTLQCLEEYGGDYVRTADVVAIFDCSRTFVHKLIKAGAIRGVLKFGKDYRIPTQEVRRLRVDLRIS